MWGGEGDFQLALVVKNSAVQETQRGKMPWRRAWRALQSLGIHGGGAGRLQSAGKESDETQACIHTHVGRDLGV